MQKTVKRWFPLFVLPTLIAFSVAFLIPFVMGIYLSFTEFRTILDAKWVGLDNYIRALSDKEFINALWFSTKFTVVSTVTVNVFGFSLALLLTRKLKGTNLFRTIFFMPNLIGGIVLGYIWQLIINGVLVRYGVTLTSDAKYGFWGLVLMTNWQLIGYMMIIYIAGIQNVSQDLLEAASIDGANSATMLTKIKIPMVMPSITICLFLTLSNCFKMFDQNLALTAGAPSRKTVMLGLDIYYTFYNKVDWEGVGQAKAVIFFIIVGIISLSQLVLTRRKEVEN